MIEHHETLLKQVALSPHPLVFATISGAHLYGFPSPDSDFDLRGTHVLPLETALGLDDGDQTIDKTGMHDGLEIDLVTHDISKFFALMIKKNGYVLEQVHSPLIVFTTPKHEELRDIAQTCVTKHHAHHYLGFAANQWKLFTKEDPPRVKPLLYIFRVLLTGIHLMRSGEIEANLLTLNAEANLTYLDELIDRKLSGPEKGTLPAADLSFYESEFKRLITQLESDRDNSSLPEATSAKAALNDLLVRIRIKTMQVA